MLFARETRERDACGQEIELLDRDAMLETMLDQCRFELPTSPLAEKIFPRYVSDAVCSMAVEDDRSPNWSFLLPS
jgi:hypothetical protein